MEIPRLREWREFRGLTQKELAERAGVSERSVFGYESGGGARPNTARRVAHALGIEVPDLVAEGAHPKEQAPPMPEVPLKGIEEERRLLRYLSGHKSFAERLSLRAEELMVGAGQGQEPSSERFGALLEAYYDLDDALAEDVRLAEFVKDASLPDPEFEMVHDTWRALGLAHAALEAVAKALGERDVRAQVVDIEELRR
ncbi:MAG: helix-turn-helix domain-containing protein, partial [Actinomycetota bacterium]|nr:helix-turn-helix domain-containing protein [Actinomycetota bacterium]